MKKNIAFYISANGRESANRCSAIIETLLRLEEEAEIFVVSHLFSIDLLKKYLGEGERIHYYNEETDVGIYYYGDSDGIDWEYTKAREKRFVDSWENKIERAEEFLRENGIGLVVSDLCPWIFPAADNLRIRSILISDFTWDQVYEGYLKEEICDAYRECYELASKVIAYELHQPGMEEVAEDYQPVSFAARPYDMKLIQKIRSESKHPLVYLQLDLFECDCLDELPYQFINGGREDVEYDEEEEADALVVPENPFDYMENVHNYIAACDYVIAHPEWDVMAYALLANKKAAYYIHEDMDTERYRVELLKERSQCIEIGKDDICDISAVIEKLKELDYCYDIGYHNDDYDIAKIILGFYPKKKQKKTDK